jgi:hypothetical protein
MKSSNWAKPERILYVVFSFAITLACFLRPSTEDFDRFVYEALVRSAHQPVEEIYTMVKHESPRAEISSVLDSPAHLAQLEPLYAIRPLYLRIVSACALVLAPRRAINAVSAGSLLLIALLAFWFTGRALYSGLFMMSPEVIVLGRLGGPDALSTLVVGAGCIALLKDRMFPGLLLLMLSIWIRTDNVLLALVLLAWLVWNEKIKPSHALVLGALAIGCVEYINFFSGNYGWKVLLHYSFVGGRYPAEITTGITVSQYLKTFLQNLASLLPQLSPFMLLGAAAWQVNRSSERQILLPVLIAAAARYALFPSMEARYFASACLMAGLIFIRAIPRTSAIVHQIQAHAAAA